MKGFVLSDLHIMAAYTTKDKHWKMIDRAASRADFFVINGDMFELYYTSTPYEKRLENAFDFLEKFVKSHPDCQFHYIIGNHENLKDYRDGLRDMPANLTVHDNSFRMGDAVYVHGDRVLDKHESLSKVREYHSREYVTSFRKEATTPLANVAQHPFRVVRKALRYPKHRDLDLFLQAMASADDPQFREGIKHVFYAHTHLPKTVENYDGSGVSFYNTGAGVQHATFNMLEIDTGDKDKILNVTPMAQEPKLSLAR